MNNNLDFTLQYDKRDEMGLLCASFEDMREQLKYTNHKMWRMMEEQIRVNAAFAHDLRTPLTVLRGYSDLVIQYVLEGKIGQEKLVSTLSMMSRQISRLEVYTDSMKRVTSLEELEIDYEMVSTNLLKQTIEEDSVILSVNAGLQIEVTTKGSLADFLPLDTKMVYEVTQNLLNNAVRYAKTSVNVEIAQEEEFFTVTVCDDGQGFQSEDLINGLNPYYKAKTEENTEHLGLGLYISSVLCERHGGKLVLANGEKGAKVIAVFKMLL